MEREPRTTSAEIAPAQVALAGAAARLGTLGEVLRFGFAQRPPWELVDVIVQDEFTHDVIVRGAAAYLVFDTT